MYKKDCLTWKLLTRTAVVSLAVSYEYSYSIHICNNENLCNNERTNLLHSLIGTSDGTYVTLLYECNVCSRINLLLHSEGRTKVPPSSGRNKLLHGTPHNPLDISSKVMNS